jgi:Ni,Fe-hydrogenase III small subunit/ferredoxin
MVWILRGLRDGIVTTRYPRRPDGYGSGFRGTVSVRAGTAGAPSDARAGRGVADLCPTGAIGRVTDAAGHGRVTVDRGRCILCGRCVDRRSDLFAFAPDTEVAELDRSALVVPHIHEDEDALDRLRLELDRRVKALRRSIHIRHVDCGSDGSEEWEINALGNPIYDVQRLGIYFTATPRHADILLATGVGTAGMVGPVRRTLEAMPDPKVVIAVGTDATSGGLVHPTYASGSGLGSILPVDVWVPGSPPSPFSILHGILLAIGLLPAGASAK